MNTGEQSSKDANLDKIFWFKLFYSIIAGVAFGVSNFTGFISCLMYIRISKLDILFQV
jgi:hypothetical protein